MINTEAISTRLVLDDDLEKENLIFAGETLAEIWSNIPIDQLPRKYGKQSRESYFTIVPDRFLPPPMPLSRLPEIGLQVSNAAATKKQSLT